MAKPSRLRIRFISGDDDNGGMMEICQRTKRGHRRHWRLYQDGYNCWLDYLGPCPGETCELLDLPTSRLSKQHPGIQAVLSLTDPWLREDTRYVVYGERKLKGLQWIYFSMTPRQPDEEVLTFEIEHFELLGMPWGIVPYCYGGKHFGSTSISDKITLHQYRGECHGHPSDHGQPTRIEGDFLFFLQHLIEDKRLLPGSWVVGFDGDSAKAFQFAQFLREKGVSVFVEDGLLYINCAQDAEQVFKLLEDKPEMI